MLAREMTAARDWLPGGIGGTSMIGGKEGFHSLLGPVSKMSGRALVECRLGEVEGLELAPNPECFLFSFFLS